MSEIAGARGSNRRTLLLCGAVAVGVVVMLLAGFMAEASVKQVYWAVYSRLHPMRDSAEAQGMMSAHPVFLKERPHGPCCH